MRRKEYLKILEDEINERIKLNAVFFDIKDFGAVDSKGYCSFREKLKSNDEYYLERNQDYQAICNILKSIKGIDFSKTYIFNKYIKNTFYKIQEEVNHVFFPNMIDTSKKKRMRAFGQTSIPSVHEYPQKNDDEKLLVTTSIQNWKGFVDFVSPLKCAEIVEQLHHLNELPYNIWSLSKLNILEKWQALNYRDTKIRLRTLIKLLESVEVIFQYAQGGNLQHTNKLEQSLKDIENRISSIYELKCLFHDNRMIEDLETILLMIKTRKSEKEDLAISRNDFYLKKIKAQKLKLVFDLRYL